MSALSEVREEALPLLQTRVFAYDLLRRTFLQEPSRDYLALAYHNFLPAFPFQESDEIVRAGVEQATAYMTEHNWLNKCACERLLWDYTRLFIGPDKLAAPPWESVYVQKERLLFQTVTLDVRQTYLSYGFLPAKYRQEPDDHVGLELDFMYQLAVQSCSAETTATLTNLLTGQKTFLEGHLLHWIPSFCQDVSNNALTGFYQGMAKLLHGFLLLDKQALAELMAN